MVGFIRFARFDLCISYHLEGYESCDCCLILRFLYLLIVGSSCSFAWSCESVFLRVLLCPLRMMRLCSLLFELTHSIRSYFTLSALSEGSIAFLLAIILGKADEPFCGIKVHRNRPLTFIIDLGVVFRVSPFFGLAFRVFPVYRKNQRLCARFSLCLPFLGAPL